MKNNVIIQEFNITIEGTKIEDIKFPILATSLGRYDMVMFGFDKEGNVISPKLENQYFPIQKEWIEKEIDIFLNRQQKIDYVNTTELIYIGVVQQNYRPNAVMLMLSLSPIEIYDYSVTVTTGSLFKNT